MPHTSPSASPRRLHRARALLLLSLLPLPLIAQAHLYPATTAHPAPAWFVDVAPQAGLTVHTVSGNPEHQQYLIETTGSGVAILDYDNDGWPDIFLVNGTTLPSTNTNDKPTSHLFHNNHDGTFTDVTRGSGLEETFWGQGACVGDYDNDGLPDLFVTAYGRNRLFHNEGHGHFREVAETAGVAGTGKEWGTGCAFIDYDRDGKLDIAVANYVQFDLAKTPKPGAEAGCMWKGAPVMCGPRGLPYTTNLLFHNLGNGKFEDASKAAGIQQTPGHYCFSVTPIDYNEDGWPDLYLACDSTPSILYRNNHDGTFTDVAGEQGVAFNEDGREQAGMGSTAADYDGDGHLDLFKTNFSDDTSTLYHANDDGSFTDNTAAAGLAINTDHLGWGAMFADVDNDGYPDLLIANGHVYPEVDAEHLGSSFKQSRLFYSNQTDGHFRDLSRTSGPGLLAPLSGRGLAIADLWNDGRLEAVINNLSDRPMLLVNLAKNTNHWLGLRLLDTHHRDALGARVTLHGTQAGKPRVWVDEVRSGSSYSSSSDLRLHIGLGAQPKLSTLDIRWPDGSKQSVTAPALDALTTLSEGTP
ncbi:MAG TPA: CRTAC1 family protein [Acidobacteriaceae bacterium]|nr:CRTAC1 family protein [Acidobacteriaceae bacterium]